MTVVGCQHGGSGRQRRGWILQPPDDVAQRHDLIAVGAQRVQLGLESADAHGHRVLNGRDKAVNTRMTTCGPVAVARAVTAINSHAHVNEVNRR
jgi:hypothetical protein